MAVQECLINWNLTRLCDQFKGTSLTSFLSISHNTAVREYGEEFASHHRRLCDKLRTVLYSKRLTDKRDGTPVASVAPCNADDCLIALTADLETMCVSRNGKPDRVDTVPCSPPPRTRVSPPRSSETPPIANRLGPMPKSHYSINKRLGFKKRRRNRRRFVEHRDCDDNYVRRNLNPGFQEEIEYNTPRANRHYAFTVPRVPVKERLGTTANALLCTRAFSHRGMRKTQNPRRRLAF